MINIEYKFVGQKIMPKFLQDVNHGQSFAFNGGVVDCSFTKFPTRKDYGVMKFMFSLLSQYAT